MTKPTVLPVPAVDRDLLDHWRSVTDDAEALIFADRLEEIGEGERAELARVTVELAKLPPPTDGNVVLGEYICERCWVVSRREEFPGVPGRCPHCGCQFMRKRRAADVHAERRATLTARRRELEARLSVWPCEQCRRVPRYAHETNDCPACGGSGDALRQTTQVGILAPQFHIDWWAGYPRYLTLLALADAVEQCRTCGGSGNGEEYHRGRAFKDCRGCKGAGYVATPRLRALCDPEHPPPWGVPLEAVMVEDREPERWDLTGNYFWTEGDGPTASHIPSPVFRLLPKHEGTTRTKAHSTPDAAKLALGKTLVALARG